MAQIQDAKKAKLETLLEKSGNPVELENEWLSSLIVPYQPNLVVNGTFSADTNWTKGTSWTIGGGVASHADLTASSITQTNLSLVLNTEYLVEYDVLNYVAGNVQVWAGAAGMSRTANGHYSEKIVGSTNQTIGFYTNAAFIGSVDNFTVQAYPIDTLDNLWNHYLFELGYTTGSLPDKQYEWLGSLGYIGSLSDRWFSYWTA